MLFKIKEVFNLVPKNKAFLFIYNIVDIKSYNFLTSNSKKNIIVPYKQEFSNSSANITKQA